LSEDEGVLTAVTQLAVDFSEVIEPLGGDRGIADPAPYHVLTTGPNGVLDTVDCTAIPAGDDVEIAVDGAWAWSDEETVSLQIAEPTGLHAGRYGLLVCDVVDLAGNALPAPFIRRFTVNAGNLLSDPNFDQLGAGTGRRIRPTLRTSDSSPRTTPPRPREWPSSSRSQGLGQRWN
jgi:hypothetical protein